MSRVLPVVWHDKFGSTMIAWVSPEVINGERKRYWTTLPGMDKMREDLVSMDWEDGLRESGGSNLVAWVRSPTNIEVEEFFDLLSAYKVLE